MNWIESLQTAINYIEDNLEDELDAAEIAQRVYMSAFHFQRCFSMLLGITPAEYIRKRRLSCAAQELSASDKKVIDIAMKYGYDSPDSFTKAFTRFHGITPAEARKGGATLRLFNRLSIIIDVKGGNTMDYRIEKREGFSLAAVTRSFNNDIINEDDNMDIHNFWLECGSNGTSEKLLKLNPAGLYGVCEAISKKSKSFRYVIGALLENGAAIPEGMERWDVEGGMWAVFDVPTDDDIGKTWDRIFTEFLPQNGYEMLEKCDFEYYPSKKTNGFCEIWIPVRKL